MAVALDSRPRAEFKANSGTVKIPFRFNLEDCHNRSFVDFGLPPSVNSKEEGKRWAGLRKHELDSQYDITYSITASAFSQHELVASKTQRISVLPVSEAQPPLVPSDFPGESFLAVTTPQRSKVHLTKTCGRRIEVAGQEPEPILLNTSESLSHGLTELPFVMEALPQESGNIARDALPTQCQLKAQLVTKTFVTPNSIENEKAIPILEEARYGDDSHLRLHRSDEQELTVAIPRWSHYSPSEYAQSTSLTMANDQQVQPIDLRLQGSPSYLISQATGYLVRLSSRRYSRSSTQST